MNKRDKLVLIGLYLSKYDRQALTEFSFNSFQEAFNILGISLEGKPSSIKNYRDEFDPFFSNNRRGWHKRPIRDYCKAIYDKYNHLSFSDLTELIKCFFIDNYEIKKSINKDYSESILKRQLTGKAAEEYFKNEYFKLNVFHSYNLIDTTLMGCGFDYKLHSESDFYCVEVKGLSNTSGAIQMTEKEFIVANEIKSKYCLFVVKNFKEKPFHDIIFDPLNSNLNFKKEEKKVIQTTYNTIV